MSKFMKGSALKAVKAYRSKLTKGKVYRCIVHYGSRVYVEDDTGGSDGFDSTYFEAAHPNPPHKHAELIKAWADGAEIEAKVDGCWVDIREFHSCGWFPHREYRIKPATKEHPHADKIKELEATIAKAQEQLKELEKGL